MPSHDKIYIVLTSNTFKKSIYNWLVSVHDCYVLQRSFYNEPFEKFCDTNTLEVVNDSDEEAEQLQTKRLKTIKKKTEASVIQMSLFRS